MRFRGVIRIGATCALVFAQLAAFTSAPSCPCDSPDMGAMPGMTGGDMHHMPANANTHHRAPCSHPMTQGECTGMLACSSTAVIPVAVPAAFAPAPVPTTHIAAVTTPRSVSRAPEPPPPRA